MNSVKVAIGEETFEGFEYPSVNKSAVQLKSGSIVRFFQDHWDSISPTGRTSLLRSLKIPEPYFNHLTPATQTACLAEASSDLYVDLQMLIGEGKVEYVTRESFNPKVYADDPFKALGIEKFDSSQMKVKMLDCINGRIFCKITPEVLVVDEYVPAVQFILPLFYNKPLEMTYGLYKVRCTNGALDTFSTSGVKMSFVPEQSSGVPDVLYSMIQNANDKNDRYMDFLDRLREEQISFSEIKYFLDNPMLKRTPLGKAPLGSLKKHAALIDSVSNVPPNSPTTINNWYDVLDTLTFYAARNYGENSAKRASAETGILTYFAERFDGYKYLIEEAA